MSPANNPPPRETRPEPGTAPGEPAAEEMPRRFGKYTLIRKVAVGGMAELFLGIQRSMAGFEKLIVIKRILPHLAKDTEFIEMLLDEARIAATLNHPNVAHTYDVGVFQGQYYIAMEHIHGEDLRSIVRQMKKQSVSFFPLEHTLAIVLGCCTGLAYAHEKRDLNGDALDIVHRDVSPQNIVVTFSGEVKLVDFGIAKAGRSSAEDTKTGKLKGKAPYMSPEQAQGNPLDGRSDVFSLGIILFELTTGRRLFRGGNDLETMRLIVEGDYPKPRDLNPNLHERLEQITMRALAQDRSARYQSARELQGDLEAHIRDQKLAVSPLSLGEWMQTLFADKLLEQKRMLQEGRQLADVLAAQIEREEAEQARGTLSSGVRVRKSSKVPWLVAGAVILASAVGVAALWNRISGGRATGPGVIAVSSDPPGAAVWLDGERLPDRTPARLTDLPVGAAYTVKLTEDGYEPFTQRVQLSEEVPESALSATLHRLSAASFAALRVRTVPSGAQVLMNGAATGQTTPATIAELTPGVEHTLSLALDGYVTRTETLTLEQGAVRELAFELERTPLLANEAILRLDTVPPEARVRFGGRWHDTGSPYEFRTVARAHRLEVTAGGHHSERRSVVLPGGEVTALTVTLRARTKRTPSDSTMTPRRGSGTLTFDARPWCTVWIDGRRAGQTPIVNRSLPAGRHRIRCTNPDLNVTRRLTIQVEAGRAVRKRISLR